MRKNSLFWLITILFISHCHIRGASLTGMVIDSETNEPVFGVSLICRDVAVAFSDDEGRFTLTLDNLEPQDVILFKHISYQDKMITLSLLYTDSIVRMESRFFSLSEVIVTPVNQQKLIKAIVSEYKKTVPSQPYWTKIHQAQSLTYRGESAGYVEYTGYMLCMGSDEKNPFIANEWIPEHVRRTPEEPRVSLLFGSDIFARISEHSINRLWTEYRFFDITHPLGKYNKDYEIRVDSSFTSDGEDYWVLSYRQKSRIAVTGWGLSGNSGQMWIEKNSNMLVRLTGSCNQGNHFVTQVNIAYGTFDNKIVPHEMYISVIQNTNLQGRRTQDKILYESVISFPEAADRQKKKYKGEYMDVFEEMIITELPFESEYWKQFPAESNMNFSEGAQLPIFRDLTTLQELQIQTQKGQQQMKNEIVTLTWEKIEPIP
ncbi:MAG: carboxypeptidase-like regulatory domain-containing protein [Tannerella sp.]|nr:carboxypeptidase-like regulatory domain-containing protein [Tannerella sp.]